MGDIHNQILSLTGWTLPTSRGWGLSHSPMKGRCVSPLIQCPPGPGWEQLSCLPLPNLSFSPCLSKSQFLSPERHLDIFSCIIHSFLCNSAFIFSQRSFNPEFLFSVLLDSLLISFMSIFTPVFTFSQSCTLSPQPSVSRVFCSSFHRPSLPDLDERRQAVCEHLPPCATNG